MHELGLLCLCLLNFSSLGCSFLRNIINRVMSLKPSQTSNEQTIVAVEWPVGMSVVDRIPNEHDVVQKERVLVGGKLGRMRLDNIEVGVRRTGIVTQVEPVDRFVGL